MDTKNQDKSEERELAFHYNRERRLEKASDRVRQLYAPPGPKRTLLGTLMATRGSAFLLLAILMLSATSLVVTFLNRSEHAKTWKGHSISIEAIAYDGQTYVVLKRIAGKAAANPLRGTVQIVLAADSQASSLSQTIAFDASPRQDFRFALSNVSVRVTALLIADDGSSLTLSAAVK